MPDCAVAHLEQEVGLGRRREGELPDARAGGDRERDVGGRGADRHLVAAGRGALGRVRERLGRCLGVGGDRARGREDRDVPEDRAPRPRQVGQAEAGDLVGCVGVPAARRRGRGRCRGSTGPCRRARRPRGRCRLCPTTGPPDPVPTNGSTRSPGRRGDRPAEAAPAPAGRPRRRQSDRRRGTRARDRALARTGPGALGPASQRLSRSPRPAWPGRRTRCRTRASGPPRRRRSPSGLSAGWRPGGGGVEVVGHLGAGRDLDGGLAGRRGGEGDGGHLGHGRVRLGHLGLEELDEDRLVVRGVLDQLLPGRPGSCRWR